MATITPELRQATREWFRDNALACIAEAESGEVRVNDLDEYRAWRLRCADEAMAGEYDRSLTFLQRASWIAGEPSVPLLPMYSRSAA